MRDHKLGEHAMPTRRTFLKAGGCALVAYAAAPRFLLRTARAAEANGKVLVAVFQRGAVDGLSMVMPYGEAGYVGGPPSNGLQPPKRGETHHAIHPNGLFPLTPPPAPPEPHSDDRARPVNPPA